MRYQFRYALLTYAQCGDLDPFLVCNHLASLNAECIIGREHHEDGGIHLHAFVDFGQKRFRSSNVRIFDVEGHHPNVSPSKGRPEEGFDYAIKDGDVVAGGLERPSKTSPKPSIKDRADEILNAQSEEQLYQACRELAPDKLLFSWTQVRAYAKDHFRQPRPSYSTPKELRIDTSKYPALNAWVEKSIRQFRMGRRGKSLVLVGPSRLGKTVWARSISPNHIHWQQMFNLDDFDEDADYAIFDDIQGGLEYFPGYKGWLGHQLHFTATDKYRGKRQINWGKPAIWCSNSDPRADKGADADWLDANCDFVFIEDSIVSEIE